MILDVLYNLLPVLFNLSMGVWILAKRPSMPVNRAFFFSSLLLVLWGCSEIFVILAPDARTALQMDYLSVVAGLLLPAAVFVFVGSYVRESLGGRARWMLPLAAVSLVLAVACTTVLFATDEILSGAVASDGGFQLVTGPLFFPVQGALLLGIAVPFLALFAAGFSLSDRTLRRQTLILGLSPFFALGMFVGLEFVPFVLEGSRHLGSYPATIVFCAILGIASRRTQLMSMRPGTLARRVLDAHPDGVVLADRTGRIHYRNEAFLALQGSHPCKEGDELGRAFAIRSRGFENLFSLPFEELPPLLDLRGDLRVDGESRLPVVATFRKVEEGPLGSPGAVFVFRDERPIRRLETEMIHLEKMHSLGIMVSGIAHELNNPLTAILGYAELGREPLEPAVAQGYFRTIYGQARKAFGVVKNLVDFSGTSLSFECDFSLNSVLEEVVKIRKYDLELLGHRVRFDLDPDLPRMQADPHKVKQIVLNIFHNAAQAVERSGRPGEVHLRTARRDRSVIIEVRDTGPGVPEEVRERIFVPFFTTLDPGQGTGLGLSISQVMAADLGGSLVHVPTEEPGALFRVTLPLTEPAEVRPRPPSEPLESEKMLEPPRVLVVDDDPTVVEMMREILSVKGCRVEAAEDGEQAWEKILDGDYDVILCDLKMPRLDGRALVERLRGEAPHLLARMVIVTGDTAAPQTQTYLHATDLKTLTKPFRIHDLLAVVRQALAERFRSPS